jgi:hypothetical protein
VTRSGDVKVLDFGLAKAVEQSGPPGGKAVLFTSNAITTHAYIAVGVFENGRVVVQPLPSGPRKVLVNEAYYGRFVRSGHV